MNQPFSHSVSQSNQPASQPFVDQKEIFFCFCFLENVSSAQQLCSGNSRRHEVSCRVNLITNLQANPSSNSSIVSRANHSNRLAIRSNDYYHNIIKLLLIETYQLL